MAIHPGRSTPEQTMMEGAGQAAGALAGKVYLVPAATSALAQSRAQPWLVAGARIVWLASPAEHEGWASAVKQALDCHGRIDGVIDDADPCTPGNDDATDDALYERQLREYGDRYLSSIDTDKN